MELEEKAFSPEIVPLMQEENRLMNEYQKLYASAQIPFMGKTVTVAQLGPYKESTDRATRRAALESEGSFFDENREQFDALFDKLVKNRTQQAKALGFDSFVELGAIRRMRNCYTPADVASFRDQVVGDLVPLTVKIKERQAKRLGIAWEDFTFTDNALSYKDGSAAPQGTPEEILAAGKKMYEELSPETRDFIHLMFDNDLFDVLAKEGKAPGGYCTSLPDYGCPFIFSNFNGTSGDVDVLTHEAGHAFADFIASQTVPVRALSCPTMEGAETHSMSMEFLTAPWHHLFFGDLTDKYELSHAEDALLFIPYGCLVDHFQEEVSAAAAHLPVPLLLYRLLHGPGDEPAVLRPVPGGSGKGLGEVHGLCAPGRHQDLCGLGPLGGPALPHRPGLRERCVPGHFPVDGGPPCGVTKP